MAIRKSPTIISVKGRDVYRFTFSYNDKVERQVNELMEYYGMDCGELISFMAESVHSDKEEFKKFNDYMHSDYLKVLSMGVEKSRLNKSYEITAKAKKMVDKHRGAIAMASYLKAVISYYYSCKIDIIPQEIKDKIKNQVSGLGYTIAKAMILEDYYAVFIDVSSWKKLK
jgi:hypothetical protein